MGENAFWSYAAERPSRVAAIDASGRTITAGELCARANRLVNALRRRGIRHGDAIAVLLENRIEFLELYFAATQAGWYITPINTHLSSREVAYILQDCEAKAFFCSEQTAALAGEAADQVGFGHSARYATSATESFASIESLIENASAEAPIERVAGAAMTYTSGTTGHPKGVRRPLAAEVTPEVAAERNALFLSLFGITPHDGVHLVSSPLYHTAVLNFCTNHMHFGHTVVLTDKWSPEAMLRQIARYRITSSHMVPTQFRRLLALPTEARNAYDISSLKQMIHSAAPCPIDIKRKMIEWWGPVILEYYAASEGGGTMIASDEWLKHPGSVGRAWPISKIRILRDDATECQPREVGTVYMSMAGHKFEYFKDKAKTQSSWQGDEFTVGDAGYLDEDRYLYLCDRKSDMIISGGVNIYPAEIEAVLALHPKVGDVAVFGIPDDDWGEQIKAVIEPSEGVTASAALADELIGYCREQIAAFKCPRSIDFCDALPRDPNGKLYKRKLRDPYWADRPTQI